MATRQRDHKADEGGEEENKEENEEEGWTSRFALRLEFSLKPVENTPSSTAQQTRGPNVGIDPEQSL